VKVFFVFQILFFVGANGLCRLDWYAMEAVIVGIKAEC
jgi:hypothetical protein